MTHRTSHLIKQQGLVPTDPRVGRGKTREVEGGPEGTFLGRVCSSEQMGEREGGGTQRERLLSVHTGFRDVHTDCVELTGQSRLGSVGQMAKEETSPHRQS